MNELMFNEWMNVECLGSEGINVGKMQKDTDKMLEKCKKCVFLLEKCIFLILFGWLIERYGRPFDLSSLTF